METALLTMPQLSHKRLFRARLQGQVWARHPQAFLSSLVSRGLEVEHAGQAQGAVRCLWA